LIFLLYLSCLTEFCRCVYTRASILHCDGVHDPREPPWLSTQQ